MTAAIQLYPTSTVGGSQYGIWVISIYDDEGNLTDGNNIRVYYRNTITNVVSSIQVGGQSVNIYNGLVQQDGTVIASFELTGQIDPAPPGPPPVNPSQPDLVINSIVITQKADSGGNNGKVTINAYSSQQPLYYAIDNPEVIFPSGTDITVTAGNHIAYVTDSASNQVTQPFNVPKVDSILVSDPSMTQGGLVSRWNAAFNPIVFTYQRKDFAVTNIVQWSTTLKPQIYIDSDLTNLTVGDFVYLEAGMLNGDILYKGTYRIADFNAYSIIIDADFVTPDTVTGFANIDSLRPYYKVITRIKYVDPSTGRFNTIDSTNRPISGVTRADISNMLQSILQPQPDKSDYTAINYRDTGLAASYTISYAETWEGNTPEFSDIDTPFYVTFAAGQLQQITGVNMFEFVTQPGGTQLARWLTDFIEPSYSVGFPFDLPFIYSEQIAGRQVYYRITALDINRQPLGDTEYTSFLLNEDSSFILNQDQSKLIIARQQLVNTPIVEHVGINRLLIDQDFGQMCYFLKVGLYYTNNGAVSQFTVSNHEDQSDSNIYLYLNDSDTYSAKAFFNHAVESTSTDAGAPYKIRARMANVQDLSVPKMSLVIKKNDIVIFSKTVDAPNGTEIIYTGISQPGAIYQADIYSRDGGFVYPDVNTADNAPVDGGEVKLTEDIIVKVDHTLPCKPVYIRWIGLNGAWNYWRFNYNQTLTYDIQNPVIIKQFVTDWLNGETIERVISKDAGEKLQLFADELSEADIDGLRSAKSSTIVQYLTSINPIKWQTVVVNSSTFTEYDTQNGYFDFGITFNKPSINNQTN